MTTNAGKTAGDVTVEPGVVGCVVCVAHEDEWWHGAATTGPRAARAASHEIAQASSASGGPKRGPVGHLAAPRALLDHLNSAKNMAL